MALVCRSCFAFEEPKIAIGPIGIGIWLLWLVVSAGACLGGVGDGMVILEPAITIAAWFAAMAWGRRAACAACGGHELLAPTSPAAIKIIEEHKEEYVKIEALRAEARGFLLAEAKAREEEARQLAMTPLQRRIADKVAKAREGK